MVAIAILGATGHVGQGLVSVLSRNPETQLVLYARDVGKLERQLDNRADLSGSISAADILSFGEAKPEVIINAVGGGDPAVLAEIGPNIFRLTEQFDNLVLDTLAKSPDCLYLNFSSGAVYGDRFDGPAGQDGNFAIAVNDPPASAPYRTAKLNAELKHRAHSGHNIVDLRLFSYFSRFIDPGGKFFMAELVRCLQQKKPFETGANDMVRDYVGPEELGDLVERCVKHWQTSDGPLNGAIDFYSAAPIGKLDLLDHLSSKFGLDVAVSDELKGTSTTGSKNEYWSTYRGAEKFGYAPERTSIDVVTAELSILLGS